MRTLQEQYNAIKNGNGNKAQFLKQARHLFPQYVNQYSDFDTAAGVLKSKQIISEAAGGVVGKGFDIWDWKKILAEETKATEKETSKEVLDAQKHAYNNSDMKNADNVNFNEIMKGFYAELKDEKNKEKSGDELKAIVVKNLAKDPLYYTKNGEFGTKGVGYTTEAPGLGEPKEPKGKHKSSGYGDLKENKEKRELSLQLIDKEDKKGLALYKNTKDQNDLYYYDGKVLYSIRDDGSKGPSVRMSLFNITGLREGKIKENTDILDYYLSVIDSNNMSKDEAFAYLENEDLPGTQIDTIMNYAFPIKADKDIPSQGMTEAEQKLRSLVRNIIKEELNKYGEEKEDWNDQTGDYDEANLSENNESPVKKGDILYHKNSDSTLEVTNIEPKSISMKVIKVSDKTPTYIKVGQKSKTSYSAIGKTYIKKEINLNEGSIPAKAEKITDKVIKWYENHPNPKMKELLNSVEKNIENMLSKTVGKNAISVEEFEKIVKSKYGKPFEDPNYSVFKKATNK